MADRHRNFSAVIHDVPPESKGLVHAMFQKLSSKYLIALEPYGHQPGYHLHMFYTLKSQSNKFAQIKKFEKFKWGRVQCDVMQGSFDQAQIYLINPDKEKQLDPNPIVFPNTKEESKFCACYNTKSTQGWVNTLNQRIPDVDSRPLEEVNQIIDNQLSYVHKLYCKEHKKWHPHAREIPWFYFIAHD